MDWALVLYLILINASTFIVYGADKKSAKKKGQRVPEKTLMGLTALGGSIGALAGMYVYHHKVRKMKFYLGVPTIFAIHVIIAVYLLLYAK